MSYSVVFLALLEPPGLPRCIPDELMQEQRDEYYAALKYVMTSAKSSVAKTRFSLSFFHRQFSHSA